MTCPAADFVEESFLLTARESLSNTGLFVVNLVSRSASIKDLVLARMKTVRPSFFLLNNFTNGQFTCKKRKRKW